MASRLLGARALTSEPRRVSVWPFYAAFVAFVAFVLLAAAGIGAWVCWIAGGVAASLELRLLGASIALGGVLLAAAYGYALFAPRRPWAWRYHLALLVLGIPVCPPLALPLLFIWFRADTRRQFASA